MRAVVVVIAALALAPAAAAWTRITPIALSNHADPSVLIAADGSEVIAYAVERAGSLQVIRGRGSPHTIASGWASISDPQLLRQPNGMLLVYVSGPQGIVHFTSSDNGATWTGPSAPVSGSRVGDVQAAAIRPDGTPVFTQDGTGFIEIYMGLDGGLQQNAFTPCCGYGESLAVDSAGITHLGFWSNATAPQPGHVPPEPIVGTLHETLTASGAPAGDLVNVSAGADADANRGDRVPLVADAAGNVYTMWGTASATVGVVSGDRLQRSMLLAIGGDYPHFALATEPAGDKVWAAWTMGGALCATRSRHRFASRGATVCAALPQRPAYLLEAVAPAGALDAYVSMSAGSVNAISVERMLPGLTVRANRQIVRVLDDGFGVGGARLFGAGWSLRTNAQGKASLRGVRRHILLQVRAAGYTPAAFRVP